MTAVLYTLMELLPIVIGRITPKSSTEKAMDKLTRFYELPNKFCDVLTQGDAGLVLKAKKDKNVSHIAVDSSFLSVDCQNLKRGYITDETILPVEESSFAIAFSILIYKDVNQFERLLRAVYRPQNSYCVHVDRKSPDTVFAAVEAIASCFDNVYVIQKRVAVTWGTISVVEAEMQCMRKLLVHDEKWRYLINLSGQDYPLKTMWQLVRILQALNGANSMEASRLTELEAKHSEFAFFASQNNITAIRGAVQMAVVRGFVQFVVHSPLAVSMLDHLRHMPFPEETFFTTINHNPLLRAPGAYLGKPETDPIMYPFINRYRVWYPAPCGGMYQHWLCVFGVRDLSIITDPSRKELFASKLIWNFQHYALDCLEKWFWNETINELTQYARTGSSNFDLRYYSKLRVSRRHV